MPLSPARKQCLGTVRSGAGRGEKGLGREAELGGEGGLRFRRFGKTNC